MVTGAGSGIGRAFAVELAKRGGAVVCADIALDRAEDAAAGIERDGGRALAVRCDVAQLAEVEQLSAAALDWFGDVPSLVVNEDTVVAESTTQP